MRVVSADMVNEQYEPTENDEAVLNAFKDGRERGEPWGRANPRWLIDETGLDKGNVEFSLRQLTSAGWLRRVARGCYEFVSDPREDTDDGTDLTRLQRESAPSRRSESGGTSESDVEADQRASDGQESPAVDEERVEDIVQEVSTSWDDDDRLEDRRDAARGALRHMIDRGQLGRREAVQVLGLYEEYPVANQDDRTWWRQNIRPVLSEIGTYSKGRQAYVLDEDAI
jgi:hypothetical protein